MPEWPKEVLEVIGALGIGSGVVGGLAWLLARKILERDRAKHRKELEAFKQEGSALLEAQRAAYAKDIYVHQLRFQKERDIYDNLWRRLRRLRGAAAALRAEIDIVGPDDSQEKRRKEFAEAYTHVLQYVEDERPFYEPEVHEAAMKVLGIAFREGRQDARMSLGEEGYCEEAEKHIDEINGLVEEVCTAIRRSVWDEPASTSKPKEDEGVS